MTTPNITMQDMTSVFPIEITNPSQNIERWIKEGILLPKTSGHIRDASYPGENLARLHLLLKLRFIQPGYKPRYNQLRLVLWIAGFEVAGIKADLQNILVSSTKNNQIGIRNLLQLENLNLTNTLKKGFGEDNFQRLTKIGMLSNPQSLEDFIEDITSFIPPIDTMEDRTITVPTHSFFPPIDAMEDTTNTFPSIITTFGDINLLSLVQSLFTKTSPNVDDIIRLLNEVDSSQLGVIRYITYLVLSLINPVPPSLLVDNSGIKTVETLITLVFSLLQRFTLIIPLDFLLQVLSFADTDSWLKDFQNSLEVSDNHG